MSSTKEQIVQAAITLFNERGFSNVRIRDIASHLGKSPGNITYYFRNKEDLLNTIYRYLVKSLKEISMGYQPLVESGGVLSIPSSYLQHLLDFRFFYQDTLEIIRAYPSIGELHRIQVQEEVSIVENLLYLAAGKRILVMEPAPGVFKALAETTWQIVNFWFTNQTIIGKTDPGFIDCMRQVANLYYNYFTPEGSKEYYQFLEKLDQEKNNQN